LRVILREATRDDTLRLDAFLAKRHETSMFLRGNLRDYSIGRSDHPNAMRYFLREKGGAIQGVTAISNGGTLMVQAPDGIAEIALFMKENLPQDTEYTAMLGESGQVAELREAFGMQDAPTTFDDVEPLFSLDLDNLVVPANRGSSLRKPVNEDLAVLEKWAFAYMIETGLGQDNEETRAKSKHDAAERMKSGKMRVLVKNGDLVAQTAFNAVLPDTVQVGGVYTPPERRVRGYARLAVALHLAEARAAGVKNAVLFSADENASRAYRAIGFEQIGHYTITLFAPADPKD